MTALKLVEHPRESYRGSDLRDLKVHKRSAVGGGSRGNRETLGETEPRKRIFKRDDKGRGGSTLGEARGAEKKEIGCRHWAVFWTLKEKRGCEKEHHRLTAESICEWGPKGKPKERGIHSRISSTTTGIEKDCWIP